MLDRQSILNTLTEIVNLVTGKHFSQEEMISSEQPLSHIIYDSSKAIQFVVLIEEEFEIELDDDEIDRYFFSNTNHIIDIIIKHIANS
jgi:acyl carrier protein